MKGEKGGSFVYFFSFSVCFFNFYGIYFTDFIEAIYEEILFAIFPRSCLCACLTAFRPVLSLFRLCYLVRHFPVQHFPLSFRWNFTITHMCWSIQWRRGMGVEAKNVTPPRRQDHNGRAFPQISLRLCICVSSSVPTLGLHPQNHWIRVAYFKSEYCKTSWPWPLTSWPRLVTHVY